SVKSANPEGFISLDQDPLAARPSPQPSSGAAPRAEPGSFTKTNARAPMADTPESMETRAAPAATEEQPPRQALLADETLYGVAGEPVSLGIVLPEAAAAANISIAVEGVTAPATITGGTRLGGETWMVDARQATSAALLTPATYPGGTFRMNVRLVSND